MPVPPQLPAGTTINARYHVRAFLGGGAAGEVYRVFDEHLQVEVALKLLHPAAAGQPADWEEARVLEKLRGDYLLPVYNADIVHGSDIRYITTKIMVGGDVESNAAPHGVECGIATRRASQVAHAAERVHSAGLLHRDIKPGNAFLDSEGSAHLADLGKVAKMDAAGRAAADGTLATVAPEAVQPNDAHCSVASEIYSLGATAFYLLTGEYPIANFGVSRREYRDKILRGERRRIRDLAPHVTQSLAAVVGRALSQKSEDRQSSALEFANQISSAKGPTRPWRRVVCHAGHFYCLEAPAEGTKVGVHLCVATRGGSCQITPAFASGRVMRQHVRQDVKIGDVPKELRSMCSLI